MTQHDSAADGVALIAAERCRQVKAEGWTPEHDAHHTAGEMGRAAACYALAASAPSWSPRLAGSDDMRGAWPLQWEFKQADPVRMLIKAGALIAAEIDRLLGQNGLPPAAAGADMTVDQRRISELESQLEHAKSALAGDKEGIRLWMLDCGALVEQHRNRADNLQAEIDRLRSELDEALQR